MKICSKCKEIKGLDKFYKKLSHKDGLNSQCKTCVDNSCKIYNKNNPEKVNAYKNNWTKRNPDKIASQIASYRENSPEKLKETKKSYKLRNKGRVNADTAKRRAAKLKRTPPWLTKEQYGEIQEFYDLCKELQWLSDASDILTVDHIVPLQGENVSGLHVPWNLQILPMSINSSKLNRL